MPDLRIFSYQDRLATIVDSEDPDFKLYKSQDLRLVEPFLLDRIDRYPHYRTVYRIGDQEYTHTPAEPAPGLDDLLPRLVRNFFVFRVVNPKFPRPCDSW